MGSKAKESLVLWWSLSCCHHPGSYPWELQPRGQAPQQSKEELNALTDVWKGSRGCWRQTRTWGLCYIPWPRACSSRLPAHAGMWHLWHLDTSHRGQAQCTDPWAQPWHQHHPPLHAGFALAESSASCQELCFSFLWLHWKLSSSKAPCRGLSLRLQFGCKNASVSHWEFPENRVKVM